ncbi:hypothetical protein ACIRPX_38050 [Streptomyces sp. NPDC101225]|uniref:hypothetical protein n=1 Tax=Streptomyces sp. NPDC101225 TaxID=3366135 RepID=UPI0038116F09
MDDRASAPAAGPMDPGRSRQAVVMQAAVDGVSGTGITLQPAGGSLPAHHHAAGFATAVFCPGHHGRQRRSTNHPGRRAG